MAKKRKKKSQENTHAGVLFLVKCLAKKMLEIRKKRPVPNGF